MTNILYGGLLIVCAHFTQPIGPWELYKYINKCIILKLIWRIDIFNTVSDIGLGRVPQNLNDNGIVIVRQQAFTNVGLDLSGHIASMGRVS